MMSLMTVLNASVGSTKVLVVTGNVVFMGTSEGISRLLIGFGPEGIDKVDMKSKVGEHLVGSIPTRVGAGIGKE